MYFRKTFLFSWRFKVILKKKVKVNIEIVILASKFVHDIRKYCRHTRRNGKFVLFKSVYMMAYSLMNLVVK